jgi:uracil-DNA glycosylase
VIVYHHAVAQALGQTQSVSSKKDLVESNALQATESLRWWVRSGVRDALDDVPHNRFSDSVVEGGPPGDVRNPPALIRQSSEAATGSGASLNAGRGVPANNTETSTRALVQAAADLQALQSIMVDFKGCALKQTATQLVFADGIPGSRVMFVGEAPGEDEDRTGRPFVGRAGQLLDRMLNAIGLDRQKVYIANIVPWRPPGNRTPTPQETEICLPFIEQQIHLADPQFLVCLGGSASRTMLGVQSGIMRARGSWFTYPRRTGREIQALAMLHPAYLLRQPAHKRFAWADMRALANALKR